MNDSSKASSLHADWIVANPGREPTREHHTLTWHGGSVLGVEATAQGVLKSEHSIVCPTLSNAHDHARSLRASTLGAHDKPLESWLSFMGLLPGVSPYLVAACAFARTLKGGVSTLMVHYTRQQGGMSYVQEALEVAKAAKDVGVSIGFAVAMRDQQGLAYAPDAQVLPFLSEAHRDQLLERMGPPKMSVAQHLERLHETAAALEDPASGFDSWVNVQYGPNGVQWCSPELLGAIAKASERDGRGVHMHLLETRYQREWSDHHHPQGVVKYLDDLGLLSPRLTLAHCTWAREDELDLLVQRGVTIAVNASSNLHLHSGIANVAQMIRCGCRVAMGLDGLALDEDDDAFKELRLNSLLHNGWGFEHALSLENWWDFACVNAKRSIMGKKAGELQLVGALRSGASADFLTFDLSRLDDEEGIVPGVDPMQKILARAVQGHIDRVVVRGREVVRGGQVVSIDEVAAKKELFQAYKSAIARDPTWPQWQAALNEYHHGIRNFYTQGQWLGCC